nr:LPXTG cell wall anchor domain-containing protein [Microbacterium immunditiarum]
MLVIASLVYVTAFASSAEAAAQGCSYAADEPNNGAHASTICWFDFAGFDETEARLGDGQAMTVTLEGGYVASFTVKVTDAGEARMGIASRATPLESRFAFGTDAYRGIVGSPALYSSAAPVGTLKAATVTLDDISVTDVDGQPVTGFSFVVADVEDNVAGESFTWQSDSPLNDIETLAPGGSWGCKTPTGLGTTTVSCAGVGAGASTTAGGKSTALLVAADTPTTFSTTWVTPQRSGIALGIQTAKVTVTKEVASRAYPGDSFDVAVTSPEGTTLGSASTEATNSATTGRITVLPRLDGQEFTLSEAATQGSSTDLANYSQDWTCVNNAQGSETQLPSGSGANKTVIPAVGDDIICTVTNESLVARSLSVSKTSDASESTRPGDTVTYSVKATNTGDADYTEAIPATLLDDLSGVLDDATYNNDATADQPGDLSYASPLLSWTGPLAAGESVTLTYTVTLEVGGDGYVRNVAWEPTDPEDPETPACDPPEAGVDPETGEPCAEVEYLLPRLGIQKTADRTELPAIGEQVEYTVTVTNVGPGTYTIGAPATATDDLSNVLDDASYNDDATASTGEVSYDEPTLSWSGALAAGESATITYTATYTGEGDQLLRNLACVPASETVPGEPSCDFVEIPGAGLTQWKHVQASSTSAVAGTVLTYTLFFNNDGAAAAGVDAVDDLTHVTDDADVTREPTSADGLSVTRDGDRIAITGSVPAGETYTVTYQVTIKEDGERGDDIAANFLLDPITEPPTEPECGPADEQLPDCTTTPIAAVVYSKSVSPESTPIEAGTVLTYTVTVMSTGTTTAPVSREDVLIDVLDDADLTSAPISDTSSVTVSEVVDGRFQIGGELAAGETATITYQVTVKDKDDRGNNSADNFVVEPGETPPVDCEEGSTECTSTPLPVIEATKSSNPESGATVVAGQEVTYTLTFSNSGEGVGVANYLDDLSGVLDDATLTAGPEASDEALTVGLNADDTIAVSGELQPGQTVTVSYSVTVLPDGQRGDNRLGNVLAPTGTTDPECGIDGVFCTEHPVPLLESWKAVEADTTPVAAGTVLTYTLFFENTGQGTAVVDEVDDLTHVTDDADVTTEPTSADGLNVTRDGNRISITGEVPAGETYTVTYQVTAKADGERGDDIAANFLLNSDEEPPTDPVCQPEDGERPDCTVTPIGRLLTGKSVSADTDPVDVGTVLTYTLTFDNQGQGPIDVDHTDILTDVLDDADLTTPPAASDDALTVSDVTGGQFTVTGELAPGQTITVTYQVTVKEEADRGNNTADNFHVPTGENPPEECVEGDPNCTVTQLPLVEVSKTADPETGSDVQAGQEVTYTLTFTNSGDAAGPVDYTDNLAAVLDDADLTGAPVSSDPALVPSSGEDGTVRVTGTLAPDQTVTVSYTVTVKPDGERGDNRLRNVVAKTGTTDPQCDEPDVYCTEHPIGELDDWKTVDPTTGSTLRPGETATYTLHFENTGQAPVEVNRDDVLTKVLDDADVTAQPVASSDALTASAIENGRFTVTGTLQPGQVVTVTYTVTVKPDGQRGDDRLDNFLVPNGEEPPETCVPADGERPDCTYNHVSDLDVAKSSDPKSGSKVDPGQEVTYTLTFTNRGTNPDAADVAVDYTDHMADVLDDATLTAGPVVSHENLTATANGDTIRVTGAVPTGEVYTVTYTVKVNAYDKQGNHHLGNVVAITGEPPVCVDESPLCTEHDVPKPPPGGNLPNTGATISMSVLLAALLLLGAGGGLVLTGRRRRVSAAGSDGAGESVGIDELFR